MPEPCPARLLPWEVPARAEGKLLHYPRLTLLRRDYGGQNILHSPPCSARLLHSTLPQIYILHSPPRPSHALLAFYILNYPALHFTFLTPPEPCNARLLHFTLPRFTFYIPHPARALQRSPFTF